jgi:GT2 family glycosyltransferase
LNGTGLAWPRVAVLLPVRNGALTLRAALESLEAQSFREFRVVVVDDGSTDETPRILREALARRGGGGTGLGEPPAALPALTVVRLEPGAGIAGALAAAAQAAGDAEFLARQDADDCSLPERFARQVAFLDSHPGIGLVATGVRTVTRQDPTEGWRRYEGWLASCVTPDEIARGLWIESPLPHPTVMMRRTAYELAGGYREVPWAEDYDLWLRMLRAGIAMGKLPETLYEWGDHPGRATRALPAYTPEAFHACRAHHLARHLDGRGVIVWGAGRDGRRASRALLREGVDIRAFLDIDPRKIGRTAYGRPILAAEDWLGGRGCAAERAARDPAAGDCAAEDPAPPIVLAAVGTRGARELIRARLVRAGLREGPDFLCIA